MHRFFQRRDDAFPFSVPDRVYALLIDDEDGEFVLFDAVDATFFDQIYTSTGFQVQPASWRSHIDRARIFAIEINAFDSVSAAAVWLKIHPRDTLPEWSEIELIADDSGEAAIYDNIFGPPMRARVSVKSVSIKIQRALQLATDLTPDVKSEADIQQALPSSSIEEIFVLDVGQGSANALVTGAGAVIGYVDLGAGVLADIATWPTSMGGICLRHDPIVILTHWHYDHFHAANIYPAAQGQTWIAPLQTLGPGPQSAMASAIASTAPGALMIWSGTGTLRAGDIELERCTGPATSQNRTGLAVWVWGPNGLYPILLPGDAGYSDIPNLKAGRTAASLVAAHHGGSAPGTPPMKASVGVPRVALSYGYKNSYRHPLTSSLHALVTASGWSIGHPGTVMDERRTEDRPGGAGGSGFGHIRLNWAKHKGSPHSCVCGCTLDPTQ